MCGRIGGLVGSFRGRFGVDIGAIRGRYGLHLGPRSHSGRPSTLRALRSVSAASGALALALLQHCGEWGVGGGRRRGRRRWRRFLEDPRHRQEEALALLQREVVAGRETIARQSAELALRDAELEALRAHVNVGGTRGSAWVRPSGWLG